MSTQGVEPSSRRNFIGASAGVAGVALAAAAAAADAKAEANTMTTFPGAGANGATDAIPPAGILGSTLNIQHVAFLVKDIEASVAWWKDKLGFKEWVRIQPEHGKPTVIFLRSGGIYLELLDGSDAATGITLVGGRPAVTGFLQTGFVVEDAETARQALEKRGVQCRSIGGAGAALLGGPGGLGPNLKMGLFWDLDGNQFQLWSGQIAGGVVTGGKVVERF